MKRFFFHRPDFVFRDTKDKVAYFYAPPESSKASVYFSVKDKELISLDKSPFGSFVLEPGATESDLHAVIRSVEDFGKSHGIEKILIKCFPQVYSEEQSTIIEKTLHDSGFTVKYRDITQVINIRPHGLSMNVHRKRRLKKCIEKGFEFCCLSYEQLPAAYTLFTESRRHKGYPVTMTLDDLAGMFLKFPETYLLFGVLDKDRMIAAAVIIVVNEDIVYCFYLGDSLEYRIYSPVTFLINGLYKHSMHHYFSLIDLGISTDKGVLNEGLYNFKKSLGCVDSNKVTFEKIL